MKKSAANEKLLTQVELEHMSILWKLGQGSVNDVLEALPKGRPLAYTSVSTILRILEQKGYLSHKASGRAFSTSLWLMPFSHGTNTMAVGATRAM